MLLNNPVYPGIDAKADSLIPSAFSGDPKRATVTFSTPFADTGYSIVFSVITNGAKTFSPAAENKTANGFQINLHSNNVANLIEVGWQAIKAGE